MRAKSLILLVIALGCGMVAAVAVSKTVLDKDGTAGAESTLEIFVAVKDLQHGQKISAENVKLEKWPKNRVPEGAIIKLEQLEDKFTNQMIFTGEPLLDRKLADSRESFSTGIPPGYRIFDIPGNAGYIKPGDRVDVVGTFELGGRNSTPETRTVMRNVQVFGINGVTTRDSDEEVSARNTTFQLLVKESQLEALTLADQVGELRLSLRPFGEGDSENSNTDTGRNFLNWLSENREAEEEPESQPQLISTPLADAEERENEMVIITPNGVTRYRWESDDELPQEVVEEPASNNSPGLNGAGAFEQPSGNVYSGYGGYSPTYPTGAPSSGAGQSPAPNGPGENGEALEETTIQ